MSETELPFRDLILNGKERRIYGSAPDDPYFSTLVNEGEWPFLHICQRYVRDDYNCLDIGANVGLMTLHLSEYCTSGKIVSVEANRSICSALKKTIESNNIKNAVAVHAAINDEDRELRFREESAFGRIDPDGTAIVEGMTLSALVSTYGIGRIDFIKMDVEGYEPVLLRGNLDLLKRDKPLLFVEFNSLTLILETRTEPFTFLEWLVKTFAFVHVINYRSRDVEFLTRLTPANLRPFIRDNLVKHGFVDDLLITDDPNKLAYADGFLNHRFRDMQMENAELKRKLAVGPFGLGNARALVNKISSWAARR
jgi:FkbM family methyltransferase